MGRHPQSSQDRRRNNSKKMKFAISILFLAATSRAAPSISDMNTGSVHNTLDSAQKRTDIQITNKVMPDIQRNFDLIKQTNEREYKETSQIYEYIDASIAHATKSIMKAITDLKTNTDESIRALGENTRENLISLKTINNENNQKILEQTVASNDSALALSLNWMSRRMDAAEDILTSRVVSAVFQENKRWPVLSPTIESSTPPRETRRSGSLARILRSTMCLTRLVGSSLCPRAEVASTRSAWGWS